MERRGATRPASSKPQIERADTQTHAHTHKHTYTHTYDARTNRRGLAYQSCSTLEHLCLSAAIWFPSPCLFVDATRCMSRTVIDGLKRCPRIEGLTNQLPIKLQQLEDVRLALLVSNERWTAGVGGSRLVITLAGGGERWTAEEAVSSSYSLFIDTWFEAGGLRWMPTRLGPRSGACFKLEYVLMLMLM